MAVVIIKEVGSFRGGAKIPAAFFQGQLPGACLEIHDIDVPVLPAVEVRLELIGGGVNADRPDVLGGRDDVSKGLVGQSDELLLFHPVNGEIAEISVPGFLNLLLRLEPSIPPMPEQEVRDIL